MKRKGIVGIFAAFILIIMLAIFALAVDLGYLCLVRTELQAASDAAALAGAATLFTQPDALETVVYNLSADTTAARLEARRFVNKNSAAQHETDLDVDLNISNAPGGDIVLGHWNASTRIFEPDNFDPFAVRVRIPMIASHINGQTRLPFGFITDFADSSAFATAVAKYPVLLPFATSVTKWQTVDEGTDEYTTSNGVEPGSDGIPELVIFPDRNWDETDGLPPGNFGALRIGPGGTSNLRDHIAYGPTVSDLAVYGGELYEGLVIPGETGIMAGMEPAFVGGTANGEYYAGILGEPRYLPLYDFVSGNGTNARFVIRRFVGVRVMAVSLKSGKKWLRVQPVTSVSELVGLHLVE